MKRILRYAICLLPVLYLAACNSATPQINTLSPTQPTAADSLPAAETEAPALSLPAPLVVEVHPGPSEEVTPDTAVELVFDQNMDQASVEDALTVVDSEGQAVKGAVQWTGSDHLSFKPASAWQKNAYYDIALSDTASADNGRGMDRAFTSRFKTIAPLMVSQVFPADGAEDVESTTAITVMFNRPVVALQTVEDQAKLPVPILISPEVKGKGRWVNSTIYTFEPAQSFTSGSLYTISVAAGLNEVTADPGLVLDKAFSWKFTTRMPSLVGLTIDDVQVPLDYTEFKTGIGLKPAVIVSFSQPMNPSTTNKAISITAVNGQKVGVKAEWNQDKTSVIVSPSGLLSLDSDYQVDISTEATAADGGPLAAGFNAPFHTVAAPRILSTYPADGTDNFDGAFSLQFASPMDAKSIESRVLFEPKLEGESNYYYSSWDSSARFDNLKPSTSYTVTVLPGIKDLYGNQVTVGMKIKFATAPLGRSIYLNMPWNAVYRADAPQQFFLSAVNLNEVYVKIYKVTTNDMLGMTNIENSAMPGREKMADFTVKLEQKLNDRQLIPVDMQTLDGKALTPGVYLLLIDSPDIPNYSGRYYDETNYFIITDTFLTLKAAQTDALVWATNPTTGKPVSGLQLEFHYTDRNQVQKISSSTTDADGLIHFIDIDNFGGSVYVKSVEGTNYTFAQSGWGQQFYLDDFGFNNVYSAKEFNEIAYLYTDRPMYRPGQPVYFKGIVRQDNDLEYLIPTQKEVQVVISSYDSEVYRETLPLSASGTFNGQFTLDSEAALGYYTISVGPAQGDRNYDAISFNVAEYRKPDYRVTITPDKTNLLTGGGFTANLQASYYSGGALDEAAVEWTLIASPFVFTPPEKYNQFSFSPAASDDNWYSYTPAYEDTRQLAQGSTTTDADGKASILVPAKVPDSKASQSLTFEATVTGKSGYPVSERTTVTAHASEVLTGIRPLKYVGKAEEEQTFELVALDWNGQPLANQLVSVVVNKREWYSVQKEDAQHVLRWETSVKNIPVARFSVKTDENGLARGVYTPAEGGVYQAVVTAYDQGGRSSQAAVYQWVSGSNYVSWRQTNDRSFQTVADKNEYKPGDTAEILIASPFQGDTYALITVERAKIRHQEVIKLSGNSTIYKLPITADMGPAVYISTIVVKGMDDTNPHPAYKASLLRVDVSTDDKLLDVKVTPDKTKASPGEKVNLSIQTKGPDGKPISSEVSLALVDLSSLALTGPNSGTLQDYFYSLRGLQVQNYLTYDVNIDEYNLKLNEEVMGEKAGGGGGDEGYLGVMAVRKDFPDTAYWNATIQTDQNGKASVTVTLPGNLTTWRVDARAVTGDTLVGQTTTDITSNKPLMVQPYTPRFFINGDQSQISALISNRTESTLKVAAELKATGLTLVDPAARTIDVAADDEVYVSWNVEIPADSTRVDLTISVESGEYKDASLPTLGTLDNQGIPVYRYEAPETVGTSGMISGPGQRTEGVQLPALDQTVTGTMRVEIEPSLASGMEKGVTYLENYPYLSMDVTVSQALSALAVKRALANQSGADSTENLKADALVNYALQRIYAEQKGGGGWSWWADTNSDPVVSSYVMLALARFADADIAVSADTLSLGNEYLRGALDSVWVDKRYSLESRANIRSFILYALAENGVLLPNVSENLFKSRDSMSYFGKAYLIRTLQIQNPDDPKLKSMMTELVSEAHLSAAGASWEEKVHDWWSWNTDTRTTAIILGTLLKVDPGNLITANTVRWLMAHRQQGCWSTTQETAWTLMALSDWMVTSKDAQANYSYQIELNGASIADGKVDSSNLSEDQSVTVDVSTMLQDAMNRLSFIHGEGDGNLYYTTYMNVNLPVDTIEPLDQGMGITRKYLDPADTTKQVTTAKPGDLLLAELTITVPQTLHYVTIVDPLPAGFEAVDATLNTNPQAIQVSRYDWKNFDQQGWGWWYFTHVEERDEKIAIFSDYLPTGTYVYRYFVRVVTPGVYQVIPPTGQETFFPDVYGRGAGSSFTVKDE